MLATKTLLLTGGEIHDWRACGYEIEHALRESSSFDLTRVNDDLSILASSELDSFDLIVLYWTRGVLTNPQKNGLLNWIASGKGFAGIHSATASFRECPEYRCMLGGFFVTHPQPRQYQVSVADPEHPITRDMIEFFVTDEMYVTDYDPRVSILASALWKGERVPVIWTKPWGDGRVFYLALGHDAEACRDEHFQTLLIRGSSGQPGVTWVDHAVTHQVLSPQEGTQMVERLKHTIQAVIRKGERFYIAECIEIPVVTQGETIEDALNNLHEAISLHLEGESLADLGLSPSPTVLVTIELEPLRLVA